MINMKEWRIYLLLALLIVLLLGFIVAGKSSPVYNLQVPQSVNCNSVNLGFTTLTGKTFSAPEGTNTFSTILVNNTGNVTESIDLNVVPNGNVPFTIESAKLFQLNSSTSGHTEFGVYSPTKTGNYSVVANLSASYLNCVNYKLIPMNITVVNATG